jgi:predicted DNA-binding protein
MFMDVTHKRINITLPKEAIEKLKAISKKEDRTHSNMIAVLIMRYKE